MRLITLIDRCLKKIGLARASACAYFHAEKLLEKQRRDYSELQAQLVRIRVAQAERPRAGWEVMCYIPEEVLSAMSVRLRDYAEAIATKLVTQALLGILHIRSQGECNALIFSPLGTPVKDKWIRGLFNKGGQFSMSEKATVKCEKLDDDKSKWYREWKHYEPK